MAKSPADKDEGELERPARKQDGEDKPQQQQAGEPKVKQVTFLDAKDDDSDEQSKKEPRKRLKRIMHQLRSQMEFYFGDSNLSKDRFMKQQADEDPEGYIPISVFMGFGHIQALTTDVDVLIKALKLSSMLQVSEDETKVRRTTPVKYMTQEETDARTVYVEGFHKFISREWIKTKFSKCGNVTYISMPRFKTSQEIKGYAFVEFEMPEEAAKAVKMLNSIPDELGKKGEEKVAASVKESKNLTYWKKRASKEGIDSAKVEASLKELAKEGGEEEGPKEGTRPRSKKKKKKNRGGLAQGKGTTDDTTTVPKTDTSAVVIKEESKENTVKQEASLETDDTKIKKPKKSKKKRKRKTSLVKAEPEDVTLENVGDAEGSVPQAKELKTPIKTEAEVPIDSKDSVGKAAIKQGEDSKESDRQISRKRRRSETEAASEQASAKVPRTDPCSSKDIKKEKEEDEVTTKYAHTSLEDSQIKQELCDASTSSGDPGKNSESQKRKRKQQTAEDSGDAVQQLSQSEPAKVKDTTSDGQKSKKKKLDPADAPQEKTSKVKKQKDGKFGGQSRRSLDQISEATVGEGRKRKRKGLEGGDDASGRKKRKTSAGSGLEVMSETEDQEGKRKRRRKHKPAEPDIRLRVMTKEMWMQLKKDYLEQQKVNMRQLKDQLREASKKRRREQSKNKQNNGQDAKGGRPPPEFVPNTILEVKSEAELCLQTIKADMPSSVQVAYVDIRPGMTEGYIRCKDAESASKLLKTGLRGLTLAQVEGEAETQYWDKLIADRETKLSDVKRRKRRGKLKILQRAQNPHEERSQRQHLIFSDEGLENISTDKAENPEAMQDDFNAYSCRRRPPQPSDNHHPHKFIGRIYFTNA